MLAAVALILLTLADTGALQDQGNQALDKGDYQKAEAIFSELVKANPEDYTSLFSLGLAEAGLSKDSKAIEHFEQTLKLKPDLPPAQLNLALLYMRGNRASDAIPLLESALRAKPDDAKIHLQLAEAERMAGDWAKAQPHYEEVLKRDPKNARAELGLGEALLHAGKLDEAGPHFTKAAEGDPSLKSFQLEYAIALADKGRRSEAIPILEQFPDNPGACEKLGQVYLAENQAGKAATAFESAVRISPNAGNRLALATAYLRSGQEVKAAPLLEQALAEAPNDWELQMTVGRIYRDQKSFAKAAGYFATAAKLKPDSPEAYSELAGVLTMAQQYGPALAALDRLRDLHAEKPGHFYLRAIILDKLRQLKPALASYQQFLRVSNGQNPDQEFQARGRVKALEHEVNGR